MAEPYLWIRFLHSVCTVDGSSVQTFSTAVMISRCKFDMQRTLVIEFMQHSLHTLPGTFVCRRMGKLNSEARLDKRLDQEK
jgi:hypothetical protein